MSAQEKITQQSQLRLQFPVSSGSTHRIKESEWVPVEKTTAAPTTASTPSLTVAIAGDKPAETAQVPASTSSSTGKDSVFAVPAPPLPPASLLPTSNVTTARETATELSVASCKPQPKYGIEHPIQPKKQEPKDSVFPEAPTLVRNELIRQCLEIYKKLKWYLGC